MLRCSFPLNPSKQGYYSIRKHTSHPQVGREPLPRLQSRVRHGNITQSKDSILPRRFCTTITHWPCNPFLWEEGKVAACSKKRISQPLVIRLSPTPPLWDKADNPRLLQRACRGLLSTAVLSPKPSEPFQKIQTLLEEDGFPRFK